MQRWLLSGGRQVPVLRKQLPALQLPDDLRGVLVRLPTELGGPAVLVLQQLVLDMQQRCKPLLLCLQRGVHLDAGPVHRLPEAMRDLHG